MSTVTPSVPTSRTSPRGSLLTLAAACAALGALATFGHGPRAAAPDTSAHAAVAPAAAIVVPAAAAPDDRDRSLPSALDSLRRASDDDKEPAPTF